MTTPPTRTEASFHTWVIVLGAMLLIALLVSAVLSFSPRVTAENYARIDVGMAMADVEQILGKPKYDDTEYGVIGNTGAYVTNYSLSDQEKLEIGYQKYRRLQWTSPEITIVVVFDSNGLAATRYRSEGQGNAQSLFPW